MGIQNPKTTILGYIVAGSAILSLAQALLTGGDLNLAWAQAVQAATGLGLIFAKDGSH